MSTWLSAGSGRTRDLVSLGRGALANPDWPARVRHGDQIEQFEPKSDTSQCDAGDARLLACGRNRETGVAE